MFAAVAAGTIAAATKPYAAGSPYNTPISKHPIVDPRSAAYIADLNRTGTSLTSDPNEYDTTVYRVNNSTPLQRVSYSGWFSDVENGGDTLTDHRCGGSCNPSGGTVQVPIPAEAQPSGGSDGNMVILNSSNGDEWDLHEVKGQTAGNVGHYNTAWTAVAPHSSLGQPYWLNGDGDPYLAGLLRPWEVRDGGIPHALQFAYRDPSAGVVLPAVKSDGGGAGMPEGSRIQLDPSLTVSQIEQMGCTGTCLEIAATLQAFGMIVANNSGSSKLAVEDNQTADWGSLLRRNTPSPLTPDNDWSHFRVVDMP